METLAASLLPRHLLAAQLLWHRAIPVSPASLAAASLCSRPPKNVAPEALSWSVFSVIPSWSSPLGLHTASVCQCVPACVHLPPCLTNSSCVMYQKQAGSPPLPPQPPPAPTYSGDTRLTHPYFYSPLYEGTSRSLWENGIKRCLFWWKDFAKFLCSIFIVHISHKPSADLSCLPSAAGPVCSVLSHFLLPTPMAGLPPKSRPPPIRSSLVHLFILYTCKNKHRPNFFTSLLLFL